VLLPVCLQPVVVKYIDLNLLCDANITNNKITLKVAPFKYNDGRLPRLPRKSSKKYTLMKDTRFCFMYSFRNINRESNKSKYKVEIQVACGSDRLSNADLDNYCKAILDGMTSTKKVWLDDRRVDELTAKRIYITGNASYITIAISETNT
jgi:hypothetical protein